MFDSGFTSALNEIGDALIASKFTGKIANLHQKPMMADFVNYQDMPLVKAPKMGANMAILSDSELDEIIGRRLALRLLSRYLGEDLW